MFLPECTGYGVTPDRRKHHAAREWGKIDGTWLWSGRAEQMQQKAQASDKF